VKDFYDKSFPEQKKKLRNEVEALSEELKAMNKSVSKKEQMTID
jgi:hypothetical protein